MECLVFARQLRHLQLAPDHPCQGARDPDAGQRQLGSALPERASVRIRINQLRDLCWQVAGVERAGHRLGLALVGVRQQRQGLERNACWQQVKDLPILEKLRLSSQQGEAFAALQEWHQRLILTELLIEAALFRQESRGGHFRTDAPAPQPFWQRHSHQIRDRAIGTTPASP